METPAIIEALDEMLDARVTRALRRVSESSLALRDTIRKREARRLAALLNRQMGAPELVESTTQPPFRDLFRRLLISR